MAKITIHDVNCPYYKEHGLREGRMVNTISFTCSKKGGHITPWVDCIECRDNRREEKVEGSDRP